MTQKEFEIELEELNKIFHKQTEREKKMAIAGTIEQKSQVAIYGRLEGSDIYLSNARHSKVNSRLAGDTSRFQSQNEKIRTNARTINNHEVRITALES